MSHLASGPRLWRSNRRLPLGWCDTVKMLMRLGRGAEALNSLSGRQAQTRGACVADRNCRSFRRRRTRHSQQGLELSAAYYNAVYRAQSQYREPAENSIYLPIWDRIVTILQEHKVKSVADLGCGPGQFAGYFAKSPTSDLYRLRLQWRGNCLGKAAWPAGDLPSGRHSEVATGARADGRCCPYHGIPASISKATWGFFLAEEGCIPDCVGAKFQFVWSRSVFSR